MLLLCSLSLPFCPAFALELVQREDLRITLDTTLSVGALRRMQAPADDLLGKAVFDPAVGRLPNAAQREVAGRWSVNSDDANLVYRKGDWISQAARVVNELAVQAGDVGAFVRTSYLYDAAIDDHPALSRVARDRLESEFRLLDAFVFGEFTLAQRPLDVRLGRQVVNWGESTFLQNGIGVVNAVDLTRLRGAGAELKEALLPADMLSLSYEIDEQLSFELLSMFEFEPVELDPVGSYFSNNDFVGAGGRYVMVGFGLTPQPVLDPDLFYPVCYGGATSDRADVAASPALRAAACGSALRRVPDRSARDGGQYGAAMRYFAPGLGNTEFGLYALNYHSRLPIISGFAVDGAAVNSAKVMIEYPEDIRLYGASFNTTLARSGIALQGEVSYRPNAPLQIDDVEILFAALSPLNAVIPSDLQRFHSQLGTFAPGAYIRGWERHDFAQWQFTASRVLGPTWGADQIALAWEVGGTHVRDLPDAGVLRYQGEGTDTGGGPDVLTGAGRNPITQADGFATRHSWGHRALLRADFNEAFGLPVLMSPRIGLSQDVAGITPGPGGNFLEGRSTLTLGVEAQYLGRYSMDLAYTRFSGARPLNTLHDRDFVSVSLRYSF